MDKVGGRSERAGRVGESRGCREEGRGQNWVCKIRFLRVETKAVKVQ